MKCFPFLISTDFIPRSSAFGEAATDDFIMTEVGCSGSESQISACPFKTYNNEDCSRSQVAGVKCAKCTQTNLLDIVNTVIVGATVEESKLSIETAMDKLTADCYPWDCSKRTPDYPEYCLVKSFLREARDIVGRDFKKNQVSLQFNAGELLSHAYTKESNSKIIAELDRISAQMENFQTELADYFATMADFDKTKATADHYYYRGVWATQKNTMDTLSLEVGDQLGDLFITAFVVQTANLVELTTQVAFAIASMATPLDAVLNTGEMFEKVNEIMDYMAELANAGVDLIHLKYVFEDVLPEFEKLAEEFKVNLESNLDTYQNISRILSIDSADELTEEDADLFLDAYNNYSPAITAEQLARYQVLLDQTVESPCAIVQDDSQLVAAMIRMFVVEMCPELQQNVEVLKALLESQADVQFDIMDSFADIARAKVAERSARELSKVFGRGSMEVLQGAVATKNSLVVYQTHKTQLINDACDTIKYMNYGVEQSFCDTARKNTDGDIGHLVSYNYEQDIQCHASRSRSAVFKIPAVTRHGNETIPEGTLDLGQLMKSKPVLFRIPSLQWLRDNEWVTENEPGPFFVKQLELYPLPDLGATTVTTSSSFSLNKNVLNGEEIFFDRSLIATFSQQENFVNCHNPPELPSPYDVVNCDKYATTCRTALGEFGPGKIYPSLIGSQWSVKFDLPVIPKMPYPKTPFHLKVFATICNVKTQVMRFYIWVVGRICKIHVYNFTFK